MFSELSVYQGVCLLEEDEKNGPNHDKLRQVSRFILALHKFIVQSLLFLSTGGKNVKLDSDFFILTSGELKTG